MNFHTILWGGYFLLVLVLAVQSTRPINYIPPPDETEMRLLREEVKEMFYHAYNSYLENAFPHDELKPLSCLPRSRIKDVRGHMDDILGNYSLTLVDSLDTLAVFGDIPEFERGMKLLLDNLSFENDITVSVFETTIRVLGGLLSIHMLAKDYQTKGQLTTMQNYNDEFLLLAKDLADRLKPAFDTPTLIPYSRVNLKKGVLPGETTETCTAGAGTLLLEFGVLSRLLGDERYEKIAGNAMRQLWKYRSNLDLVGNVINIMNGKWIKQTASIGAGIDSFYEYLAKAYILFGNDEYFDMFNKSYSAIHSYIQKDGWYLECNMKSGQLTRDWVDSLQAFWPGLQVLAGDWPGAMNNHLKLVAIWRSLQCIPEAFNVRTLRAINTFGGYPLRPEFIESTYFLYQATREPFYLQVGKEILETLQKTMRVRCGFASIADVDTKRLEDRMDSYFLSETLKYLYLLFDPRNSFNSDRYLFTTEGHMFPVALQRKRVVGPAPSGIPFLKPPQYDAVNMSQAWCPRYMSASPLIPYHLLFPSVCNPSEQPLSEIEATETNQVVSQQSQPSILQSPLNAQNVKIEFALADEHTLLPYAVLRIRQGNQLLYGDYYGTPAAFGVPFNITGVRAKLVYGDPPTACEPLRNQDQVAGNILVLERGDCPFVDKIMWGEQSKAKAVIVLNNRDGPLFTMSAGDDQTPENELEKYKELIPSMLLGRAEGNQLKQWLLKSVSQKQCNKFQHEGTQHPTHQHFHRSPPHLQTGDEIQAELFALEPYNIDAAKRKVSIFGIGEDVGIPSESSVPTNTNQVYVSNGNVVFQIETPAIEGDLTEEQLTQWLMHQFQTMGLSEVSGIHSEIIIDSADAAGEQQQLFQHIQRQLKDLQHSASNVPKIDSSTPTQHTIKKNNINTGGPPNLSSKP